MPEGLPKRRGPCFDPLAKPSGHPPMPNLVNRQVRLRARPDGIPQAEHIAGLYRGENRGKRLIRLHG